MADNLDEYSEEHLRRFYRMHGNNDKDKVKEDIIEYFRKRAEQGDLHVLGNLKVWVIRWTDAGE